MANPDNRTSEATVAAAKRGRPAKGKAPEGAGMARAVTELVGRRLAEKMIEDNQPARGSDQG